jgi:hypothetical protein
LADRFVEATEMVRESTPYFEKMSNSVAAGIRKGWLEEIESAERSRLLDPAVMDIYAADIADTTEAADPGPSAASTDGVQWLPLALAIEEKQ